MELHPDTSFRSRKLLVWAATAVLLFLTAMVSALWPAFTPTLVGATQDALLWAMAAYLGVNLGSRATSALTVIKTALGGAERSDPASGSSTGSDPSSTTSPTPPKKT